MKDELPFGEVLKVNVVAGQLILETNSLKEYWK